MTDKKMLDPAKLDKYDNLITELWSIVQKLTDLSKGMSIQERTLAGGAVVQIHSPWTDKRISGLIGDREAVANLINQAVVELQRPPAPEQPIFKKEDKKEFPN